MRLSTLVLLLGAPLAVACQEPAPAPVPAPACEATAIAGSLEGAGSVRVYLDGEGAGADLLAAELERYLGAMWGQDVSVARTPPADDGAPALWLSASAAAKTRAGDVPADGFSLHRLDDGGRPLWLVAGASERDVAHGAYWLLEAMGARFFHPLDELVPALGAPRLPADLDEVHEPAWRLRGLHVHLLHPLEYLKAFHEPGAENLADAKRVIDWLIKTGQNHLQYPLMSTIPYDAWVEHSQAIVDYAHSRGVTTAINVVLIDDRALLQNQYALVGDTDNAEAELMAGLDELMRVDWDQIHISMGEFLASEPQSLIDALSFATDYAATTHDARTAVHNHIGEFDNLYLEYQGETEYFYFLPQYADERLMQSVHTVFFFDLYREWGMYGHDDFFAHRQYIFDQLAAGKDVTYFPESAYWVTADVDVPVFLAEFVHARWLDIHNLHADIEEQGLPPLEGHILYSSGHEWSYWLIDYLTARFQWAPERELDAFYAHVYAPFGACAGEIEGALADYVDVQTRYLFDERLVSYASGEDLHDDLGFAAGFTTHPPRVAFEEVLAMDEAARRELDDTVVKRLFAAVAELREVQDRIASVCDRSDDALAPWCAELLDSVEVTSLRLEHSGYLYRALLDVLGGREFEPAFERAVGAREAAAGVIARRERSYRFPVEELVESYENPTRYKFGYLRMPHTMCLWLRQEDQLTTLVETGQAASPFVLRSCQE